MYIVGIDYSITCPCACVYDTRKDFTFENCTFIFCENDPTKKRIALYKDDISQRKIFRPYYVHKDDFPDELARYDTISEYIVNDILEIVGKEELLDKIYFERYSFGSRAGQAFSIAEATMLCKYKLWSLGQAINLLSPTEIKKYFTGKGNANKAKMADAFEDITGMGTWLHEIFDAKVGSSPTSDIIDSFAIVHTYIKNLKRG